MADLLIIDDDLDVANSLALIMEFEGHAVRVGYNGEDGLRHLVERLPDLLLLDIEMPILGGPGMAVQMIILNTGREKIPVVLLSGVANLKDIAARVGTPYYLGKPYRYENLVAIVNRALADRIAPQPPLPE